jgi:hypothetical protein
MRKILIKSIVISIIILFLSSSLAFSQLTGDNTMDPLVNLGCLEDAVVTGSVDTSMDGGKHPDDILWDPSTSDYKRASTWHEYGLGWQQTLGGATPENPMWWMCEWPTAKNINYITVTGIYDNQPQPTTGWSIQIDSAGTWVNLAKADHGWPADTLKGISGWIYDGLMELKLMQPVVTTKLRFCVYAHPDSLADGNETFADSVHSFSWTGRKLNASAPNACMIQYLDFSTATAKNRKDPMVNLALLDEAVVSGYYDYQEINGLRGHPTDMLYNPKTKNFHKTNAQWGEYGAPWQHDNGYLTHDDPFYWMVEWATPQNINYFTFGGCYGNQPQPFTPWAVEYWDGEKWVELASGAGTDREAGTWQLDSEGRRVDFWGIGVDSTTNSTWQSEEPIQTTKFRLAVWSDGIDPLFSFHVRGRGGRTTEWDETEWVRWYDPIGYVSNTNETREGLGGNYVNATWGNADPVPSTFKAILVQYRDPVSTAIEKEANAGIPVEFALEQNYPNPFNPQTNIKFSLAQNGQVSLSVYNILGQKVAELINKNMAIGAHEVTFDAKSLSTGVYYYRLVTEQGTRTKKMMLIK